MQVWHPLFVLGAVLKSNFVSPGRNCGLGIDFSLTSTWTTFWGIRTDNRKFPYGVFDGVTEKITINGQGAYCIGRAFEFAIES